MGSLLSSRSRREWWPSFRGAAEGTAVVRWQAGGQAAGGQAGGAPVNGQGGLGGAIAIRVIDPGLAGMMGGTAGGGGASIPVTGVLEIVAGQLGGEGNIDGVGTNARFRVISDMVFDPDDNRVFLRDYDSGDMLRAIDGDTARVTTLGTLPAGDLLYQRGSLYVAHPAGTQLTEVSPTDGHVLATIVEQTGPQISPGHPLLAWPDGDAMFQVSDDGRLWRVETATGSVSVTPLTGFPSSAIAVSAPVMAGPATILASVLTWYDSRPQLNEILSIDLLTGTATVVGTIPPENTVFGIDPQGRSRPRRHRGPGWTWRARSRSRDRGIP